MQTDTEVKVAELEERIFGRWLQGLDADPADVQAFFACLALRNGDYELAAAVLQGDNCAQS